MITHLIGIFPEATQCSTVAFMNLGIQDRDTWAEKVAGQKQLVHSFLVGVYTGSSTSTKSNLFISIGITNVHPLIQRLDLQIG